MVSMGWTQTLIQGQAALTETFTAADGSFSFRYPAGMTWVDTVPPQPTGAKFVDGAFSATLEIRPNAAGETATAYMTERLKRANRKVPVTSLRVAGREIAVATLSAVNKIFVIAVPNRVVILVLLGDSTAAHTTDATFVDILATFQYSGATEIPTAPTVEMTTAATAALLAPPATVALTDIVFATATLAPSATVSLTATPAPTTAVASTATVAPTAIVLSTATVMPSATLEAAALATTEVTVPVAVNGASTLAFGAFNGDYSDIFLTGPGGRTMAQFTQQQVSALLPVWSPDGTLLAYITDTSPTADFVYDVFIAPASGGTPVKVSSQPSTERGAVAWSPDSKQLIFAAFRGEGSGAQLYRVNADGTGEQKLAIDAQAINGFTLDWSPDGRRIAFMGFPKGGSDYAILFARPDGSRVTPGPNVPVVQSGEYFKWSPDGQRAVISNTTSLTVTQGDGSAPQVILDSSAGMTIGGVDWSPDGTQIAFSGYKSPDTTVGLYIVDADGSNLHQVDLGGRQLAWGGVAWGAVVGGPEQVEVTEAPPPPTLAVVQPCTVRSPGSANLRNGPGTNYDSNGMLTNPATARVTGQTRGTDGKMWWRVENGDWVRSDVVVATGNCGPVPVVEP